MSTLALLVVLAAAPRAENFGPELTEWDRITVRVLNIGLPVCTADDLLCTPRLGHGSGFLFQQKGSFYVATNGHVVERAQALTVLSPLLGEPAAASVVAADNRRDVALLKLQAIDPARIRGVRIPLWEELHWLDLDDDVDYVTNPERAAKQLSKADAVVSFGFPLDPGQPDAERRDGRFTRWYRDEARGRWLLQLDIDALAGTSGGPLLTPEGRLAGMIVYRSTTGGMGLAIPARGVQIALTAALKLGASEKPPFPVTAHRAMARGSVHLQQASYLLGFTFPRRASLKACLSREDRPPMCEVIESARDHLASAHTAFTDLAPGDSEPLPLRLLDLWVRFRVLLLRRYAVEPYTTVEGRDGAFAELQGTELGALATELKKSLPPRHPSTEFVNALAE